MPPAGLDPEGLAALEAESDLPGGWGPEDVRRFDDHQIRQAYPPHVSGTIMTTDGFKPVRGMPSGPFGFWGDKPSPEARAAYDAKIAATVAEDLLREGTPCQPFADAGRVVDDNPGLLWKLKPAALRRAAVVVVVVGAVLMHVGLVVFGVVWDTAQGFIDAVAHQRRETVKTVRVIREAFRQGWG